MPSAIDKIAEAAKTAAENLQKSGAAVKGSETGANIAMKFSDMIDWAKSHVMESIGIGLVVLFLGYKLLAKKRRK